VRGATVMLIAVFSTLGVTADASPRHNSTGSANRVSIDVCLRHPELFRVRPVTSEEGRRLAKAGVGVPTIIGFDDGSVISGPCVQFIKTVGGVVTLTSNDRFVISNAALVPIPAAPPGRAPLIIYFSPPTNVMTIASDKFAEGNGRTFVKSIDNGGEHTVLWSGAKGSAIGTIRCVDGVVGGCTLEHLILTSPYRLRDFGFVPPPHSGMGTGSLWFWTTLRPEEEALVGYTFAYENYLLGRT